MTQEQLEWLITAVSNAPVQNLAQVRHKAAWLNELADRIEDAVSKPTDPPDSL